MEYTGEDLLKVFDELNIQLLNLNPNVIKAWFDTDDPDMKKFLNWMCSSLSKENYVSPLEYAEYLELDSPLLGEKYQEEIIKLEKKYPGIVDVEENTIEIELLEDELELLIEEERQIDGLIAQHEAVQCELSNELALVTKEEIKTAAEYKGALEESEQLSHKLDNHNKQLHEEMKKFGTLISDQAYNFEIGPVHQYINNLDVKYLKSNASDSTNEEKSILEITNCTDSFANKLSIMRSRILHSNQNYLANKVEIEKLTEVHNYLKTINVEDILYMKDSIFIDSDIDAKEESKKRLCALLDTISSKQADFYISQTKLKYAQQELEMYQSKLNNTTEVVNLTKNMLAYYLLLGTLHVVEEERLNEHETLFRNIFDYLTGLHKSVDRTRKMNEIISTFEASNADPPSENFNLIKSIIKVLNGNEDFSLSTALEIVTQFKSELNSMEKKLFWDDFNDCRKKCDQIIEDIDILKSFLMCGPTNKIVIIPSELQIAIREVENHLKKEEASLKSIVNTSTSMHKCMSKWEKFRRQLWMYFITDPSKMFLLIKQIEEEASKQPEK